MTSRAEYTPNTPETQFHHAIGEHTFCWFMMCGPQRTFHWPEICLAGANTINTNYPCDCSISEKWCFSSLSTSRKRPCDSPAGGLCMSHTTAERTGPRTVPTGWSSDMKVLSFTRSAELQDARKTDGYSSCACLNIYLILSPAPCELPSLEVSINDADQI